MRPRDLNRLTTTRYDVLVVGGGIYGLTCAYEAASRGLQTALVDAGDYGGGTSFNQQKTAHGGLRSLQSLSLGRAREAIRERRTLARIAPWLLRPLPFILGTYRPLRRSRLALAAAFQIDRWIAKHRNDGVEPELHLPAPRLLSRTATTKLFPGVRQDGLTGGAQWYDYQMVENDRLTLAFAAAADRAGADLANYVTVRSPLRQNGTIAGAHVRDELTGADLDIQARLIVNAAGARAGDVMRLFGVEQPFPLVKALNLVTSKPAADMALAAPDASGRMLTLVPWRGRAIVGTGQWPASGSGDLAVTPAEFERFIADANHAFPALKLTAADVTLVHRGLVPGTGSSDGAALLPRTMVFDHAGQGADGLVTIAGAKYTTARATAERVVTMAGRKLAKPLRPSRTAVTVLPGAGIADHEALAIEIGRKHALEPPLPMVRHLIRRYAELAADIVTLISERPELAAPISDDSSSLAAEIVHVIRVEQAATLADVVFRRTTLGAAGHPGRAALEGCAAIAAAELGWDQARTRSEIAAVEQLYAQPGQ